MSLLDDSLTEMAGGMMRLADALEIGRFHVFGISLGGMVAQLVAVHHPHRVLCLFSVMSSSGNPDLPGPFGSGWAGSGRAPWGFPAIFQALGSGRMAPI